MLCESTQCKVGISFSSHVMQYFLSIITIPTGSIMCPYRLQKPMANTSICNNEFHAWQHDISKYIRSTIVDDPQQHALFFNNIPTDLHKLCCFLTKSQLKWRLAACAQQAASNTSIHGWRQNDKTKHVHVYRYQARSQRGDMGECPPSWIKRNFFAPEFQTPLPFNWCLMPEVATEALQTSENVQFQSWFF